MIVSSPVVSSIRSRHTGQVGSSINAGVGGAKGLVVNVAEGIELDGFGEETPVLECAFSDPGNPGSTA